jgi:hypothetical protein
VSPVRTATRTSGGGESQSGGHLADLSERRLEVLVDVDRQGLQGGDVDHLGSAQETHTSLVVSVQPVDAHQERRERLARAGRRRDQRVAARGDLFPASRLRRGRAVREAALEPRADCRVEHLKHATTVSAAADTMETA